MSQYETSLYWKNKKYTSLKKINLFMFYYKLIYLFYSITGYIEQI